MANSDGVFLASGARTTTQTQAVQTNESADGIRVVTDITSAGTGSITVAIEAQDPASSKWVTVLATLALTTNQTKTLLVYPGAAASANASVNDRLPLKWRINVTANNANSMTYSVGYQLLG
jgi:YbbR domain-containing protein